MLAMADLLNGIPCDLVTSNARWFAEPVTERPQPAETEQRITSQNWWH